MLELADSPVLETGAVRHSGSNPDESTVKLKKHIKYEISWVDISHENSWVPFDDVDKNILNNKPMVTLGFFIKQTKDFYVFSSGIDLQSKNYFDQVTYPKGVIISIKELNEKNN